MFSFVTNGDSFLLIQQSGFCWNKAIRLPPAEICDILIFSIREQNIYYMSITAYFSYCNKNEEKASIHSLFSRSYSSGLRNVPDY
jgi:hypothetical protein